MSMIWHGYVNSISCLLPKYSRMVNTTTPIFSGGVHRSGIGNLILYHYFMPFIPNSQRGWILLLALQFENGYFGKTNLKIPCILKHITVTTLKIVFQPPYLFCLLFPTFLSGLCRIILWSFLLYSPVSKQN